MYFQAVTRTALEQFLKENIISLITDAVLFYLGWKYHIPHNQQIILLGLIQLRLRKLIHDPTPHPPTHPPPHTHAPSVHHPVHKRPRSFRLSSFF